jgi:hypothetical protein
VNRQLELVDLSGPAGVAALGAVPPNRFTNSWHEAQHLVEHLKHFGKLS